MQFIWDERRIVGPKGEILVPDDDEITPRLIMLYRGECEGLGPTAAAQTINLSVPRYYQLRTAFRAHGAIGLQSQKRGPRTKSRRTDELVRQVIRHRFLDPDASSDVIAQKLRQAGFVISSRSVDRVIEEFGLQKKTLSLRTSR